MSSALGGRACRPASSGTTATATITWTADVNNSGAAIQVIADAVGYYTGMFLDNEQIFWAGGGWGRVYDSRAYGSKPVPPGGTGCGSVFRVDVCEAFGGG